MKKIIENNNLVVFFLILLTFLFANYLLVQGFGLYEDDWLLIPDFLNKPFNIQYFYYHLTHFTMGRPIQFLMMGVAGFILSASESLVVTYLFSAIIYSCSLYLWYRVLCNKINQVDAFKVCIFTVLSGLITVNQFLNGAYTFAPASLFIMLSIYLYGSKRYISIVLAYFFALLTLLTYEIYFWLFLSAPLFFISFLNKKLFFENIKIILRHAFFTSLIFFLYSFLRISSENRINTFLNKDGSGDNFSLILNVLRSDLFTSLKSFLYLKNEFSIYNYELSSILLGIIVSFIIFSIFVFYKLIIKSNHLNYINIHSKYEVITLSLILIILSYLMSYFIGNSPHGVAIFSTRESRLNCPAIYGHALFIVSLLNILFSIKYFKLLSKILFAILIVIFSINRVQVQLDYVNSWIIQKEWIRYILVNSRDIQSDGAIVIVVDGHKNLHPPKAIGQQPHGYSGVLKSFFVSTKDSKLERAPTILMVNDKKWVDKIHFKPNKSIAFNDDFNFYPKIDMHIGNITIFDYFDGDIIKLNNNPEYLNGIIINSKSPDPTKNFWKNSAPTRSFYIIAPDLASWYNNFKN
jgi:hypothetical protein